MADSGRMEFCWRCYGRFPADRGGGLLYLEDPKKCTGAPICSACGIDLGRMMDAKKVAEGKVVCIAAE